MQYKITKSKKMRKIATILVLALAAFGASGQEIAGQWNGVLKVQGIQLRLVFHVTAANGGFSATMDSPDQGASGIPVSATTFVNSHLKMVISAAGIEYNGDLKGDSVTGIFRQSGMEFPLVLSRKQNEKQVFKRPQEPAKPYPYVAEEVIFRNEKAGVTLAGTLTLPRKEGNFPAVILITGSGPQNRDEELMGHKPFLVISDWLTRNGIAVLRYDDRGVGQSTGDFKSATTADFTSDAESAVAYLETRKEINKQKIGLMGHSEGGIIAPMVAVKLKTLSFIVLLAGTGVRGDQLLLMQQAAIGKVAGKSEADIQKNREVNRKAFDLVLKSSSPEALQPELTKFLTEELKSNPVAEKPQGMTDETFVALQVKQIVSPWMFYFIRHDPAPVLEKVKCAVLAVNGEKDVQVPYKENLGAIEKALKKGGNKQVTFRSFPGLNHLFQECRTGSPAEYAAIEQTFSPVALEEITKWIKTITN